jgi:CRP/FNR family transcriptional regulator, nitrogen fixation regulation protein
MSLTALRLHDPVAAFDRTQPPKSIVLFDAVSRTLDSCAEALSFEMNESIYVEEEPADRLYKVVKGTVRICRLLEDGRRQIAAFLMPGDFFGLELGDTHLFSAEAVETVEVMAFDRRRVEGMARRDNEIALRLWDMTAECVRRLQEHILLLGRMNARARVSTFLLCLSDRFDSRRVRLSMARHDIADHLGLTLETVSRTIRQLEHEGFIDLKDARSVNLLDARALRRIAA